VDGKKNIAGAALSAIIKNVRSQLSEKDLRVLALTTGAAYDEQELPSIA